MSTAPQTPSDQGPSGTFDPEVAGSAKKAATPKGKPVPESEPEPPERGWLDRFGAEFGARFQASQQAVAAIPRPVALAAAAILIVPAALGFFAASYVGAVQQRVEITLTGPDGGADLVTALRWSDSPDQVLVIGTQSGAQFTLDPQGTLNTRARLGVPIADIEAAADGSTLLVTLEPEQLTTTPGGSLGQASGFGNETCRSGYVWREATVDDLICVLPEVRDQALADRAEAEAGRNVAAGCAEGLVPRNANPNDTACTTPEIAADVIEENQRHESRKLLSGAAFAGTRRVELTVGGGTVVGERGLFAISGTSIIAGERVTTVPESESSTKQAVEIAQPTDTIRLAQWTLADGMPARASEVGTLEDVRVLARQPGTDMVYAGDGSGPLYEINASVQMSGTNPASYLRQLGTQGSPITAISVASAPALDMPSLVTAAENGAIEAWWPEKPAPSRALEPPALSRPVMSRGSTWALQEQLTLLVLTVQLETENHGDALLFSSETSLSMLAAPSIEFASLPAGAERLMPPFAATPDGRWSAGYDPETRAVITYEGIIRAPLRSIPVADTPRDIALSPTGDRIAIVRADGSAAIAGLRDDAELALSLPAEARSVAFNPSGTQLAVGLRGISAAIYRADSGVLLATTQTPADPGGDDGAVTLDTQARYSPNGRQLVLLDLGRMVSTYGIRLRQVSTMRNIAVSEQLSEGKLTANGQRVVARRGADELVVYDTTTRTELGSIVSPGFTTWAASPDASIIAVTSAGGGIDIYVEQPDNTVVVPPPRLAKDGLKLSADGSTLLVRDIDGKLHVWSLHDQAEALPLATNLAPDLTAIAAELAPDGSFVVVADSAGGIYLIDLPGLHRIGIAGHGSLVQRMLLSADGRLLASASLDGVVQITDLPRARQIGAVPLVTTPIGRRPDRLQPTLLADQPGSIDPGVQQFLEDAGYGPVPIDGVLGLATRAAIARRQIERGRPPTGLPDPTLLNEAAPVALN
ncbi:hypothetical protein VW23_008150 [Devosia insulae DS-56]|uniref:Peptidoglycan binding-like domain-containing protein n=1 Tax=Devosia insulae DS-56 TaxID=1116389 RepID=A0A1E5XX15_9HYPH|nr:peptidoglycan-binding protein [Devosia insulae]OEO33124.1 hypothetical protein VW23_008150 [Devosia insulae DS-56]